jgi:adenine-specific DNA-methyltransferase
MPTASAINEIRGDTTDEIACRFIDTDFKEERFFVRHAHFTGADEPYEKIQRALKAHIAEDAWATLHRAVSRQSDAPPIGKIGVNVVNHYGDAVKKAHECTWSPAKRARFRRRHRQTASVCAWRW